MAEGRFEEDFEIKYQKIRDKATYEKVYKQIYKILQNPEMGKPMRYGRKGTREVYIGSLRLVYIFLKDDNIVFFTDIYHKDFQ